MKKYTWQATGLFMAVMGSLTLVGAQQGGGAPGGERPGIGGPKGNHRAEMLKKYDKDGDGKLSDAELEQLKADRDANRAEDGGRKGPGGPDGERPNHEEMLKKYDKDGDGVLNEAERAELRKDRPADKEDTRHAKMLKKYDKDGDGTLSEEERVALRKDMDDRKGGPGPQDDQ